jgi:hypothetical protein
MNYIGHAVKCDMEPQSSRKIDWAQEIELLRAAGKVRYKVKLRRPALGIPRIEFTHHDTAIIDAQYEIIECEGRSVLIHVSSAENSSRKVKVLIWYVSALHREELIIDTVILYLHVIRPMAGRNNLLTDFPMVM